MNENEDMESLIQQAMKPRVQHFKNQADSLTFEGVRRLLEKDLGLETHALDKHKKFVKQSLEKYLSGAEEDDESKEEDDKSKCEDDESKGSAQIKSEEESVKEEKADDSPVKGLLSVKSETEGDAKDKIPTEDMIKEAIWNKATYFRSKSEELTLAGVRRLLEEDLELQKFSLDPFKKLISKQLDEVLNSENNNEADSSPSHSESENIQPEVKPKKKSAAKEKVKKSQEPKKRKKSAQETEQPKKKKTKQSVEKNNTQDQSSDESSGGKSVKKEVVAPVYGKKVERLKSIIKACGMTVAPTVYKKAKQAPEDKREVILIKELVEILSKEGLSANPSEKDIKDVKRRKEKAKELEGIDTSNIVLGSRRRSTTFPPPKPKEPVLSESDDSEDQDEEGDGSDDQDEGGDGEASSDHDEDAHATQSGDEVNAETFDSD